MHSQSWGLLMGWQLLQFQSNSHLPLSFQAIIYGNYFALSLFAESLNSQVVTSLLTELTNFQLLQLHSRAYQCFQMAVTENRCGFKTPFLYF